MASGPARYRPDRPFPPYAYVPGRAPHPRRDPGGHSRGIETETPVALDLADWRCSDAYLYGVDLFNAGYYWEAHEAWEDLWRQAPRASPERTVLHGLIRLAAAGVKAREGNGHGCTRHARKAAALLRSPEPGTCLGLDLRALAEAAEAVAADPPTGTDAHGAGEDRPAPAAVLTVRLTPG